MKADLGIEPMAKPRVAHLLEISLPVALIRRLRREHRVPTGARLPTGPLPLPGSRTAHGRGHGPANVGSRHAYSCPSPARQACRFCMVVAKHLHGVRNDLVGGGRRIVVQGQASVALCRTGATRIAWLCMACMASRHICFPRHAVRVAPAWRGMAWGQAWGRTKGGGQAGSGSESTSKHCLANGAAPQARRGRAESTCARRESSTLVHEEEGNACQSQTLYSILQAR